MPLKAIPYTTDVDAIPWKKVLDVTPESGRPVVVWYACPDRCWREHLDAWRRERRRGNLLAPEPMPEGHCCFENPTAYGCIAYGSTDPELLRAAHEADVRGMLHGWDRDLTDEQRERIVKATVDARLAGVDLGAAPFLACISASL